MSAASAATHRAAAAPPADPSAAQARWQVFLLGRFELRDERAQLKRLPSRAITALLARLALWPGRDHAREELIELLWPGVELDVGRNRLRQALSTLKAVLEPAEGPPRPVLQADRRALRVVPGSLWCDALAFEQALRSGASADARALYAGELLPGYYDEWIGDERLRLEAQHDRLLRRSAGGPEEAPAPPLPAAAGPGPAVAPVASVLRQWPRYLTRWFGDDIAQSRLAAELERHRLLVLIGPGGAGKTRTAVELAQAWAELPPAKGWRPDLVVFVALAAATDLQGFTEAVLDALGQRRSGDVLALVSQAVAGRQVLWVLDNFEQLDPGADAELERWLMALPELRVLVTSRRSLALAGAHEVEPALLSLPSPDAGLLELAQNPAVALFVDRARAVRSEFHLTAANQSAVARLVNQLDGLPLAIELAAARVRSLPPTQLVQMLSAEAGRLDLLARPLAAARPASRDSVRHATMRAVIDWSWALLDAECRDSLAALSVFVGSFSLDAAAAVVALPPAAAAERIDRLASQSLLRQAPAEGEARLQMSPPLREYAAGRLDEAAAAAARRRLRRWFAGWAASWPATPPMHALRREGPQLLALLQTAEQDDDIDAAVAAVAALQPGLLDMNPPRALLPVLAALLPRAVDAGQRARGHALLARLALYREGSELAFEQIRLAEQACQQAPQAAIDLLHAQALLSWHGRADTAATLALVQQGTKAARASGRLDTWRLMLSLRGTVAAHGEGRVRRARRLYAAERALAMRIGNRHAELTADYNLICAEVWLGRHGQALTLCDRIEQDLRAIGNERMAAELENVRGSALCGLRRWPDAAVAFRRYLLHGWRDLETQRLAYGLWNLPRPLAHLRQAEPASRLMAFAVRFWVEHCAPLKPADERELRRLRRLLGRLAPAAQVDAWWRAGEAMSLGDAVALALQPGPG